MSDIDPITGLPKELGVWETITKENQKITAKIIKKKFGKKYTVIEGLDTKDIDIKEIAKKLKNTLACGGTTKSGVIELQGDHLYRIKPLLIDLGFSADTIDIH
jgi:translation initiation factor 1